MFNIKLTLCVSMFCFSVGDVVGVEVGDVLQLVVTLVMGKPVITSVDRAVPLSIGSLVVTRNPPY